MFSSTKKYLLGNFSNKIAFLVCIFVIVLLCVLGVLIILNQNLIAILC
ncbi:hypothetical protein LZB68_00125 [Campylobacter lari]|nr:hypothetical protein [Campylobacter lari]MCH3701214.1 hypothetical protein [Campylobacter lari]MCH3717497.1 hypothetical protein [Campylobacter lari]